MKLNQPKYATMSPLGKFCAENAVTLANLETLTGASRATMHRLLCNELAPGFEKKVVAILLDKMPEFLLKEKGMSRSAIDAVFLSMFPKGEYQPMISQRLELSPDTQRYFGLAADPFSTPPRERDEVFVSPPLRAVIDRVVDAIKYPAFLAVIGDIGAGKSTIRAYVEDHVAKDPNLHIIWPEFFDMNKVTPMQIAKALLEYFGEPSPRAATALGTRVKQMLERKYNDGIRITLGFDEGHRLNSPAISSLKNFFEMGSGGFRRYLSVLIFAQPLFETRLHEPEFRELLERIIPLRMPPFAAHAAEYLDHRLRLVGSTRDALFDAEAVDLIARQSTTPLALGNIANEAFRVSKEEFDEKRVIGAAIKTKMFFSAGTTQGFKQRAA